MERQDSLEAMRRERGPFPWSLVKPPPAVKQEFQHRSQLFTASLPSAVSLHSSRNLARNHSQGNGTLFSPGTSGFALLECGFTQGTSESLDSLTKQNGGG